MHGVIRQLDKLAAALEKKLKRGWDQKIYDEVLYVRDRQDEVRRIEIQELWMEFDRRWGGPF